MVDNFLLINFKSYAESFGSKGLRIAKTAEKISLTTGKQIFIAPQTIDLRLMVEQTKLPVFAQAISSKKQGPYTGCVTARSLIEIGVNGVLINPAENKLSEQEVEFQINTCKRLGLRTLLFINDIKLIRSSSMLNPDYIVYSPNQLNACVSSQPAIISQAYRLSGNVPLIVSGGIKNSVDVKNALLAGAKGIVVSNSIIKSNKIEESINTLVNIL